MRKNFFFIVLLISANAARAQHPFKYDNTIYKAVYLLEAFRMMDSSKNFLLLDVRSPGEYADTSRATALNIGRLKGSVNITIDSVPAHLEELKKYIDKPIFIYCSHSQRSRRVSKLLAENGFKKIYNINGGMTLVNELDASKFPDKNKYFITGIPYRNLSSHDAYQLIKNTPRLVIIDIRTVPEFESRDSTLQNNIGHLKKAINIPQSLFAQNFDSYRIPAGSPILLYDQNGYNSMDVVDILRAKGFTQIYNLFDGLEGFISNYELVAIGDGGVIYDPPPFRLIDTRACIDLLKTHDDLIILDTRPDDEFNNMSSMSHSNLGRIKGAIHIPSLESLGPVTSGKNSGSFFLVYGSGSALGTAVCQALIKKGFRNVNYLSPGLYGFVWSTANVENCREGRKFLTHHENLY